MSNFSSPPDVSGRDITPASVNRVEYATPGNVQSKIDDVAGVAGVGPNGDQGVVKLNPEATYDEGAEVTVKPGVTLDCNGAVLTHTADHNLLFVDTGAHVRNLRADIDPTTYTSDVVVLDTSRATHTKYTSDPTGGSVAGSHATVEGTVLGDGGSVGAATDGTALHLLDGAGVGITVGCRFDLTVWGMGRGVHAEGSAGGFINVANSALSVNACHTLIEQSGGDSFVSVFSGELQCATPTQYGINNTGTGRGPKFTGNFWDPSNAGTNAIAGPGVSVESYGSSPEFFIGQTDGSQDTEVYGKGTNNQYQRYVADTDECFTRLMSGQNVVYSRMGAGSEVTLSLLGSPEIEWTRFDGKTATLAIDANGDLVATNDNGTSTIIT